MKLLALDPSSTCIGYALADADTGVYHDAGRLTAPSTYAGTAKAFARILLLEEQLANLVFSERPDAIVMEVPATRVYAGNRGQGAGLTTYAFAVGAYWRLLRGMVIPIGHRPLDQPSFALELAVSDQWTKTGPYKASTKAARVRNAKALVPGYQAHMDAGGDVADAICLLDWWRTGPTRAGGRG